MKYQHGLRELLMVAGLTVASGLMIPALINGASVPFVARFSGDAMFTSATTVEFNGRGQATHLGRFTNFGAIEITGPPDENGCLPNVNIETLTAANGDQLVLEMNDISCPIALPDPIYWGTGIWHVTHGTGRFADTTGTGTVDGIGNFVDGVFELTLRGELDGIGKNR